MSLTEEEKEELILECANAKLRCKEVWQTLLTLEKITKTYFKIHYLWKSRFEKADRKLAEDRIIHCGPNQMKNKGNELTKADLESILDQLG